MTISYQVHLFFGKYPKIFINLITTTNSYPITLFFFGKYLNIFIILNITSSSYLIHLFFRNCLKIKVSFRSAFQPFPPDRVRVHDLSVTPLSPRPGWSSVLYRRPLNGYHALDTMHSLWYLSC